MSTVIMGTLFLAVLALVVYWLILAVQKPVDTNQWTTLRELSYGFNFETAPEIMAYPSEGLSEVVNSIQLIRVQDSWLACWAMQEELLEEKREEFGMNVGEIELVLRIYESSELLRHHDVKIDRLKGCCQLYIQPYKAYYVGLGLMQSRKFEPVLVSNTVIPNELH